MHRRWQWPTTTDNTLRCTSPCRGLSLAADRFSVCCDCLLPYAGRRRISWTLQVARATRHVFRDACYSDVVLLPSALGRDIRKGLVSTWSTEGKDK